MRMKKTWRRKVQGRWNSPVEWTNRDIVVEAAVMVVRLGLAVAVYRHTCLHHTPVRKCKEKSCWWWWRGGWSGERWRGMKTKWDLLCMDRIA
jgi:hypothetical protein